MASFAESILKSSAFDSLVFVGQTVTHIPHPLQFPDWTSFLSFAMTDDTAWEDMNISFFIDFGSYSFILRLISSQLDECVSAPTEIISTPVFA
jgi:hypothetical protein